jgi:uncharacterized alkaline shock family protein YloU
MSVQAELGKIQINDDVIATIASLAAVEVEGIAGVGGGGALSELWGSRGARKGVTVTTDESTGDAVIDLDVNVAYGVDVYKTANMLQQAVKNAVETMTGLRVRSVNVRICGIVLTHKGSRTADRSE